MTKLKDTSSLTPLVKEISFQNLKQNSEDTVRRELAIGLEADRIMNADFDDQKLGGQAYFNMIVGKGKDKGDKKSKKKGKK